jgi:chromosome segregation protein
VHLKSLEITGFKSFADRTRLDFEPGMVAIVGPNGCGKSNVSDAIRWVLGEQRPTALRCGKMQDVIFNGTDGRKPLNMAEVSITFTECEGVLDTEFNEVTITRRVFRSGEGHYFLNKTACRLRDIHRLLMGTGVGTTSYSVMAQGQIDAILSSKPEDRRAVFEEAAGITKFKSDRKESLRKLEQTDVNLLRLADVIREVKRQIGTLQRQAGKAQRYKELRDELRGLDLFVTRRRLAALDLRIRELDVETAALTEKLSEYHETVAEAEQETTRVHEAILQTEHAIGTLTESAAQADSRLVRAQEVIRVNEQRISEYREWSERDTRELTSTRQQVAALRIESTELAARRETLALRLAEARTQLLAAQEAFDTHKRAIDAARGELQRMREESVERERRAARIQNQLAEMEAHQRTTLLQRERLTAEKGQLAHNLDGVVKACDEVASQMATRRGEVAQQAERLQDLESERNTTVTDLRTRQETLSRLQSQAAAKRAQLDLLTDRKESSDEFQPGTSLLLDPANPLALDASGILGPLAELLSAPADMRLALEAALRAWIDAVAVRDDALAAQAVAALVKQGKHAAARLIVAAGTTPASKREPPAGTTPLLDHVRVAPAFADAADRLLGRFFLAEDLASVPHPLPPGCTIVTRQGAIFHADGCVELWMPDSLVSSPLARRMLVADATVQLTALEEQIAGLQHLVEELNARSGTLATAIADARRQLDDVRRLAAQKEGEHQTVSREAERSRQRLDIVARELETLNRQTQHVDEERGGLQEELHELIASREQHVERAAATAASLHDLENREGALNTRLTECRIACSQLDQQAEHDEAQATALAARIAELDRMLEGRSQGIQSYDDGIRRLSAENEDLAGRLDAMRQESASLHTRIEEGRRVRAAKAREVEQSEARLTECRRVLETAREAKSRADVELAESRMRRQNHFDRVFTDYAIAPEGLVAEPDPDWKGEPPPMEEIERRVTLLTTDLQAMGPVNLVAIDEYKELEERYTFLKAQETDLVKSKDQLIDLIRMINKKTSEMFRATFDQANANFATMFEKLFNGGMAKLVLLENAEDPLECGVDIIARPPGKRPQTVSLLSGGERTMTAVSLLFAIYLIKPSPFCMLDELDAALDDSNIGRFVQSLKDFLVQSQFLIITHNQHTIASTDIVYGVTMPEKGISKIISIRLKDIGVRDLAENKAPAPEA